VTRVNVKPYVFESLMPTRFRLAADRRPCCLPCPYAAESCPPTRRPGLKSSRSCVRGRPTETGLIAAGRLSCAAGAPILLFYWHPPRFVGNGMTCQACNCMAELLPFFFKVRSCRRPGKEGLWITGPQFAWRPASAPAESGGPDPDAPITAPYSFTFFLLITFLLR